MRACGHPRWPNQENPQPDEFRLGLQRCRLLVALADKVEPTPGNVSRHGPECRSELSWYAVAAVVAGRIHPEP